jgi:hypothetical protein
VYTDTRSRHTAASPDRLWNAVESSAPDRWTVEEREPGKVLRLRAANTAPGDRWLEMRITPEGDGSRYEQRAIFYPRGLLGRIYWYAGRPLQAMTLDARVRRVTAAAG